MKNDCDLPVDLQSVRNNLEGAEEGEVLTLCAGSPCLILFRSRVNQELLDAFRSGVSRYSYWESSTPVPIPVWVFFLDDPMGAFDVLFNPSIVAADELEAFVQSPDERCDRLQILLVERLEPRAGIEITLDIRSIALFKKTLNRLREISFKEEDFVQSRATVSKFNVSALHRFGVSFRGPEQKA